MSLYIDEPSWLKGTETHGFLKPCQCFFRPTDPVQIVGEKRNHISVAWPQGHTSLGRSDGLIMFAFQEVDKGEEHIGLRKTFI